LNSKKIVHVGHVCLEVSDLESAKRFYAALFDQLGFELILEERDSVGWRNGNLAIFLNKPMNQRVSRKKPRQDDFVIADHLALLVESPIEVNAVAAFMKSRGTDALFPPEAHPEFGPGYYSVSYCDPDNNVVEFYST
jgi:catechol 2,3-dioxygenase-like lactoylglutathione lyase family enzyme